ncbi:MAG: transposase family protein [Lachnospiraceae bacterium]
MDSLADRNFSINVLLELMEYIENNRQQTKVRHKLKDIIVIVLFATLANVNDWVEIFRPNLSMKKKRFVISMNPAEFIEQVLIF